MQENAFVRFLRKVGLVQAEVPLGTGEALNVALRRLFGGLMLVLGTGSLIAFIVLSNSGLSPQLILAVILWSIAIGVGSSFALSMAKEIEETYEQATRAASLIIAARESGSLKGAKNESEVFRKLSEAVADPDIRARAEELYKAWQAGTT